MLTANACVPHDHMAALWSCTHMVPMSNWIDTHTLPATSAYEYICHMIYAYTGEHTHIRIRSVCKYVLQFVDKMTTNRAVPMDWIGFTTRLMVVTSCRALGELQRPGWPFINHRPQPPAIKTQFCRFRPQCAFLTASAVYGASHTQTFVHVHFNTCNHKANGLLQMNFISRLQLKKKRNKIKCCEMNWNCFDWQICYVQ